MPPNILSLQLQLKPVDMVWDAAAHCSPTIATLGQEIGARFGDVAQRVLLDKRWLLSPSGAPYSLAQRAETKGFCQDPAPCWGG